MNKYILCIAIFSAGFIWGEIMTETVTFSRQQLGLTKIDGFDLITLPGHTCLASRGKPALPVVQISVLIPPTAEITSVELETVDYEELSGEYLPYPVQQVRPISTVEEYPFTQPDPLIYGSKDPYPASVIEPVPTGSMAGFRIGGILIHPVQFFPVSRKLRLYTEIRMRIHYEEGRHEAATPTPSQIELFSKEIERMVINPDMVEQWRPRAEDSRDTEVDFVIITDAALVASWDALKNWKTKKGINTEVISTNYIYGAYPGADQPEKIRNFVRDYFENKGLKYLLLAGDYDVVPPRYTELWIEESTIVDVIPSDIYYGDLEWSWDGDGNGTYGQMTDTVDLFHDLYVGRAPVDNVTHVAIFTSKDTTFEKHPDTTRLKTLLLASEMLFDPWHGRNINNLIASYFPDTGWQIAKCEDPPYGSILDSINHGFQFLHSSTHGSVNTISVFSEDDIPYLTNGTKYNIMTAISCMPGYFDLDFWECLAESVVNCPDGGCVAAVLNARYGLGYPPALGPSDMLDLGFFKNFLAGMDKIGAAYCESKDNVRSLAMSQAATRWCVFCLTLFGDPTMPMWSKKPQTMTVVHAGSAPGGPQAYRVTATVNGVELKDALVCLQKGSEVYATGETNLLGWVDLFINPTSGTMSVTVTARDCRPYEGTCTITTPNSQPCLVYAGSQVNDSGGNGRLDPGETANILVTLANNGNANATGVNATLRTTCPYITMTDSTSAYGSINTGDSVVGDQYTVTTSSTTPQGTEAEFILHTSSNQGTWEPFFTEVVGETPEPGLAWADHDTGMCALSVTTNGSIGVTFPYGEGSGFKYRKDASYGCLFYGSMLAGTDVAYVADRFYAVPADTIDTDFVVIDSLHALIPPILADEEHEAVYSDAGHPDPKDLEVRQWSLSVDEPGYDDWVIICYDYWNRGSAPISNLYSGLMLDLDMYNYYENAVKSDAARRFVYMFRSSGEQFPTAGIRLLEPTTAKNLAAIDHVLYVEPSGMMTEAVKDSFISGKIIMPNSNRQDNWSICASAGPLTISPGSKSRVVYAIVGGDNENAAVVNSDSAQSWWDIHSNGIAENGKILPADTRFSVAPNPMHGSAYLNILVNESTEVSVDLFDAAGRLLEHVYRGMVNEHRRIPLDSSNLPGGVYFLQIHAAGRRDIAKVIHVR